MPILIPTPTDLRSFYYGYELPLAYAFHAIEKRGVLTDERKLAELRRYLTAELTLTAERLSDLAHKTVCYDSKDASRRGLARSDYINLNYYKDVADLLVSRGLKVPKDRWTGNPTTSEDAINTMFAESGDPVLKEILYSRELSKMKGTYVDVRLSSGVLYCSYVVTGTVTGRRSSRRNVFGLGTNQQNIPKHSELGKRFRSCIVARPGKIFISCDQVQAEDWIVNGIIADVSGDDTGLQELKLGVDRHSRLAALLFQTTPEACGKDTPERFMGKKTRHAGNYDMGPQEMARQMIKEGHEVPIDMCRTHLEIFHKTNPGIKGVFHRYVQETLSRTRTLTTPLHRERIFLSLRPFADNKKEYKEAYSYIPQSTVGDNTGLGILYCETNRKGLVVMDVHDAIVLEVSDDKESVKDGVGLLYDSFQREIIFPSGLSFIIPVEFEIGYDLAHMADVKRANISEVYSSLHR